MKELLKDLIDAIDENLEYLFIEKKLNSLLREVINYTSITFNLEQPNNVKIEWVLGEMTLWNNQARMGQIDVVTSDLNNSIGGYNEGLWLPMDESLVPNLENLYDRARHNECIVWSNVGDFVLAF